MKILIGCEESQTVCKAFRQLGHEAYSCDLQPCSGGHPEWHLQCDVLEIIKLPWDLGIFHPTCTYLSNAGAAHLYKGKVLNLERYEKGLKAKDFFMKLYNANIPKLCIENPIASKIFELPYYTQQIQPYEYGHPVSKKTRLWTKNLPLLIPTNIVVPLESCHDAHTWFSKGGKERQKNRSVTFPGIAQAMATQWG